MENQQSEEQITGEQMPEESKKQLANIPRSDIKASENGSLIGITLNERWRMATAYYAGGMVPKSYKNAEQVMAGMQFAIEMGLQPLSGLRNIAIINGSVSIWGDLPLALVRKSGKLKSIREVVYDTEKKIISLENPYGVPNLAACETIRIDANGLESITCTFFSMADAKQAGLLGRENVWKTYPRRMLQMRARSQNLKDAFGDILMGASIAEYDYNYEPNENESRDVTYEGEIKRDPASELNSKV
jgi:hypothetical protein